MKKSLSGRATRGRALKHSSTERKDAAKRASESLTHSFFRLVRYVTRNAATSTSIPELTEALTDLRVSYGRCEEGRQKAERAGVSDVDDDSDEAYDHLVKARVVVRDRIAELTDRPDSDCDSSAGGLFSLAAKPQPVALPTLTLPKFSGDFLEWISFRDQFNAAVDSRKDLADVQKFGHLLSCLTGSARMCVLGIPCTAENYRSTYQLLDRRFGQPSLLVSLYANKMMSLPQVPDGDVKLFRTTFDNFTIAHREIRTVEKSMPHAAATPTDGAYDLLLSPLLLNKMPPSVRTEWVRKTPDVTGRYKLSELMSFITSELEALETFEADTPVSRPPLKAFVPRDRKSVV